MSEAIAQKLDEARALIERGWCRDTLSKGGRFCAVGAILRVTGAQFPGCTVEADYIRKAIGEQAIHDWNDRQKSKKPVIEAFRKAAALARSEAAAVGGR